MFNSTVVANIADLTHWCLHFLTICSSGTTYFHLPLYCWPCIPHHAFLFCFTCHAHPASVLRNFPQLPMWECSQEHNGEQLPASSAPLCLCVCKRGSGVGGGRRNCWYFSVPSGSIFEQVTLSGSCIITAHQLGEPIAGTARAYCSAVWQCCLHAALKHHKLWLQVRHRPRMLT